jgi:hypothetical protein
VTYGAGTYGAGTFGGDVAGSSGGTVAAISGVTGSTTALLAATGTVAGISGVSGSATVIPAAVTYIFQPPTHEEPMRTFVRPLNYFRLTWANSVVRVGGVLTSVRTPSAAVVTAAGVEGVDYFRGGGVYTVSSATKTELESLGYTVQTV